MNHSELWDANLPDTLQVLPYRLASMAWNMAMEFIVLGLTGLAWLSMFLQPK